MRLSLHTLVEGDYKTVLSAFNQDLFTALTPPLMAIQLLRFDGSKKGDVVHLKLKIAGLLTQEWISDITEDGENEQQAYFIDEGRLLPFPLKFWQHRHIVKNKGNQAEIIDDIQYKTSFWLFDLLFYPVFYLQFAMRKPVYRKYFGTV